MEDMLDISRKRLDGTLQSLPPGETLTRQCILEMRGRVLSPSN